MIEMCMVDVMSYIMYEFYYTQDMLYDSLINSLLAKTSFIFGQTLGCIIYQLMNMLLTFEPEEAMFLFLLCFIMDHRTADVGKAIAKAL